MIPNESQREIENQKIAYQAALESIVLLENNQGLPINNQNVAVFGMGTNYTIIAGLGSGEVHPRKSISIYEGLKASGIHILSTDYLNRLEKHVTSSINTYKKKVLTNIIKLQIKDLVNSIFFYPKVDDILINETDLNLNTDTAIYVINRNSSENIDNTNIKGEYYLTDNEKTNLINLSKHYKKLNIIINSGYPIDMNFLKELDHYESVLYVGYPGMQGGLAVANILKGIENPSGKLAQTWPLNYQDIPLIDNYFSNQDNLNYEEGSYVGYRYYDTYQVPVKYPFTHGLSYSNFSLSNVTSSNQNNMFNINCDITNNSNYTGKQTVFVFLETGNTKNNHPKNILVGFNKTKALKPNEASNINVNFDLTDFATYDQEKACYLIEKGTYKIKVGFGLNNYLAERTFNIHEDIIIKKVSNITPNNITEKITGLPNNIADQGTYLAININPDIISYNKKSVYLTNKPDSIAFIKTLVGHGLTSIKNHAIVGEYNDLNGHKYALSDGPAGLRVSQKSNKLLGIRLPSDPPVKSLSYFPSSLVNLVYNSKDKKDTTYMFATCFPAETNLAQTFNLQLLNEVGSAIGKEMTEFNIDYLLAPAINIQKNPFCGRNFEYFSEDPFVSGIVSAAIINGVSSYPGKKASIKHFCCNNKETQRNFYSVNVNDQALREIYLKPFEIAIKYANPSALMSSYNKVNHEYVASSNNLINNYLRKELNYEGIIMTDWYATGKNKASSVAVIKANADLIMPGTKGELHKLLKAYQKGIITDDELYESMIRFNNQNNSMNNHQFYDLLTDNNYINHL